MDPIHAALMLLYDKDRSSIANKAAVFKALTKTVMPHVGARVAPLVNDGYGIDFQIWQQGDFLK